MSFVLTRRRLLHSLTALASARLLGGTRLAAQIASSSPEPAPHEMELWFQEPAEVWSDALPLGNGRLGAMVFGGVSSERIALNEDTLWSGKPRDWNNPGAKAHLTAVREMVLGRSDYHAADQECRKMQGPFNQAYEPVGDLFLDFEHAGEPTAYRRSLDLDSATSTVAYSVGDIRYTREAFVSAPDQVVVIRLTASKPKALTCSIRFKSQLQATSSAKGQEIQLTGKAPSNSVPNYLQSDHPLTYSDTPGDGMYFASALDAILTGGAIEALPEGVLHIAGANEIILLIGIATGYKSFNEAPDTPLQQVVAAASKPIHAAAGLVYSLLLKRHVEEHRKLFRRVRLDLGGTEAAATPTDQRVDGFKEKADLALLALYFHYGRYLLIASSRPGTQPANLQGIWNADVRPPWSSNWTSNINVQMNYWLAETCNLSECHLPLVEMLKDLSMNGAKTAQVNYGASGWCSHHNIDIWRQSAPVGEGLQFADPTWANFAMSGPWLCQHLWEHYQFTGDEQYLQSTAYPIMKGAAQFCLGWLTDDGKGGLTTCPSVSTENSFLAPDGKSAQVSAGCTLDIALMHELFDSCCKAAGLLHLDSEFASHLVATRKRLPPYKVGRYGQLQEWDIDFDEDQPGQRHMSQLYPVYPGGEITLRSQPTFAAAARKSLERRLANGGAYTGWSRAWAIGLWARLGDGDMALESMRMLLLHSTGINLFDQHPSGEAMTDAMKLSAGGKQGASQPAKKTRPSAVFQIDGNFGATASLAEMLLQSHDGEIALLPAWPAAWKNGSVHGLRARGGTGVDIVWTDANLVVATIHTLRAGEHQVRAPKGFRFSHSQGQTIQDDGRIMLRAKPGMRYELRARRALKNVPKRP